jgi:hypothetical protein
MSRIVGHLSTHVLIMPPSCSSSFVLDSCARLLTFSSVPHHAKDLGVRVASHAQPVGAAAHGVQLARKLSTILWRESTDFTTSLLCPDATRQQHHRLHVGIAFLPQQLHVVPFPFEPGGVLIIDGREHGAGCPNDQFKHGIILCFRNRAVGLGVVLNELPELAASHADGVG